MDRGQCPICYDKMTDDDVIPIIVNGVSACEGCKKCYNWVNDLARREVILDWLHDYYMDKHFDV